MVASGTKVAPFDPEGALPKPLLGFVGSKDLPKQPSTRNPTAVLFFRVLVAGLVVPAMYCCSASSELPGITFQEVAQRGRPRTAHMPIGHCALLRLTLRLASNGLGLMVRQPAVSLGQKKARDGSRINAGNGRSELLLAKPRLVTSTDMSATELSSTYLRDAARKEHDGTATADLVRALVASLDAEILDQLAELLAPRIVARLRRSDGGLLTPVQAAGVLSVHPKTLTRAAAAGRVQGAVRVGRSWRFEASALSLYPPTASTTARPTTVRLKRTTGSGAAAAIRSGSTSRT